MRSSSFSRNHPYAKTRGWVSPKRAASSLPTITDGVNEVDDASEIWVLGGTVSEPEEGVAQISFGGQAIGSNSTGTGTGGGSGGGTTSGALPVRMFNNSGLTLIPGDVVVTDPTQDSAVTTTATASNTRIAGVVQGPINVGEWGPVLFNGYTSVINTVSAVTRGDYALTSATPKLAGSTGARGAGSFAVYLTGAGDFPDFVTSSATTSVEGPVTNLEINMPLTIPAGRILFLALWLESGVSAVAVDGWTQIGAEAGYYYFYRVSTGDDTAEATWTTASIASTAVLMLHANVSLSVPIEDHDYDSTTSAAAVSGLDTAIAHYAIAGVNTAVTPGSGYVRLAGGDATPGGSIALVETSQTMTGSGTARGLLFSGAIPAGRLLLVYGWRRSEGTPPTAPAGWEEVITHATYEGDKSPSALFSKISDGSAGDGGTDGSVSTFNGVDQLMGSVWTGAGSATPSDDDLGSAVAFPGTHTVTRTVSPAAGGLAVMVSSDRNFGANTMAADGSSTLLDIDPDNDWPGIMVYRLGGGSLTNEVTITTGIPHWDQSSAVAFDPGTGSVAGTLAGKYIGHDATATSPFTGGGAQNDAIFAVNLLQDAKASALLYGPDLGGSGGSEPTADAHIADTSDAHDASAVSLLDTAGLFAATDVEAAIAELAAKDIGYSAHGNMGSTETFSATTGWHSGTFNADCTFTFSGATSGIVASMVLELLEDGTGTWTPTWPGSVVWAGGVTPTHDETAGTTTLYLFQSRDGGTTWYGFQAGGGSSSVTELDDLTDVTITAPAENDTLRYISGEWVNDNRRWEPVYSDFGSGPELVWDGPDLVMEWKEY